MNLYALFVGLSLAVAEVQAQIAPAGSVLDLRTVELVPQEIARFLVRVECSPSSLTKTPETCRQLRELGVMIAFRSLQQPTGLKDKYLGELQSSPKPITKIIGDGISMKQGQEKSGSEVCSIQIVEAEGNDQYGGTWRFSPSMYPNGDQWVHYYTVEPKFAAYRRPVKGVPPSVGIITDTAQLDRPGLNFDDLVQKVFRGRF